MQQYVIVKMIDSILYKCMALIYYVAFSSILLQWDGLFGRNGIIPVESWIENADRTILVNHFRNYLQDVDLLCFTLAILGTTIAAVTVLWKSFFWSFPALWICYLSLFQVGKTFMQFQWDILLLESGFLFIFYSWGYTKYLSRFTFRVLLFKLMLLAGVVKIQSSCPTWLGLTALDYHYATQCIPSPTAWYIAQLPHVIHRLSVAATLIIEIPLTILIISPFFWVRVVACFSQIFLQILILMTGNYNFFNWLTIVLSLSLLLSDTEEAKQVDDILSFIDRDGFWAFLHNWKKSIDKSPAFSGLIVLMYLVSAGYYSIEYMFDLVLDGSDFPVRFKMSPAQLTTHMGAIVFYTMHYVVCHSMIAFVFDIVPAMENVINATYALAFRKFCASLVSFLLSFCIGAVVLAWLSISMVPMLSAMDTQPFDKSLIGVYKLSVPFSISNGYGLFRSMTGVGPSGQVARPEVVFEYKTGQDAQWQELEFLYKPGAVDRMPPWVAPYHPRLDWQMWFASLGNYQQNPWIIHVAHKILTADPSVSHLIGYVPPGITHVRAFKYHYNFTTVGSSSSSDWWQRDPHFKAEYMPIIVNQDASVEKFLQAHGYFVRQGMTRFDITDTVFAYVRVLDPIFVVVGFPVALVVATLSKRWILGSSPKLT